MVTFNCLIEHFRLYLVKFGQITIDHHFPVANQINTSFNDFDRNR